MFSLSASPAVIQSNIDLGFKEIPYHEILEDPWFVTGCQSWVDYVDLMSRTDDVLQHLAMIYDPVEEAVELPLIPENEAESQEISEKIRASRRLSTGNLWMGFGILILKYTDLPFCFENYRHAPI